VRGGAVIFVFFMNETNYQTSRHRPVYQPLPASRYIKKDTNEKE